MFMYDIIDSIEMFLEEYALAVVLASVCIIPTIIYFITN